MITPGKLFRIDGSNIKVLGEGARVLIVSASGAPGYQVGAGGERGGPSCGDCAGAAGWKIEIHTRYSRGQELKDLRVITGEFTLAVPAARDAAGTPRAEEGGAASQAGCGSPFRLDAGLHSGWMRVCIQAGCGFAFRLNAGLHLD
ncbi:MAG: hypothetical protein LBG27_02985 [Spirochaetaceae bacterium]|jgi:hypothetical protein|nr:hypothetical protein [Spirochaetaceae bacterium]